MRRPATTAALGDGRRWWTLVAVVVAIGAGWAIASTRTFTWPAELLAGASELGVVAGAVARHRHRPDGTPRAAVDRRSAVLWSALAAVAVAWELSALFGGPRHLHPTLSSLADVAFRVRTVKAAAAAVWLALGAWVAAR
ncbi:MAG: hypothetical protein M0029_02620 [Actinomycetota bacterium]|nr:hypothetical protein [Actinomycetota bacterium]